MKYKKIKLTSINIDLEVKKLPIKKYIDILQKVDDLPKEIVELTESSEEQIIASIPKIVVKLYPEVKVMAAIATDLTGDQVDQIYLDELVEIVFAVIDVNEYFKIFDTVKKNLENLGKN